MSNEEVMQQLTDLYLEIRKIKERIALLESREQNDGKVVLTGTPSHIRAFIEEKKKQIKGDK